MRRLLRRRWLWLGLLLLVAALAAIGHGLGALNTHPVWCAFHGWRAYADLKHHHPGWGAFQLWRAVHHCGKVL